jgi:hypothetical protein
MLSLSPRILVEADYFSLWQYLPDANHSKGYIVRVIDISSNILPEDICLRADNWGFWFFYELQNQGWPQKPVLIDADGFNKIGREIANSVKVYVGEHCIVGYRPILSNGGYGKIETVFR